MTHIAVVLIVKALFIYFLAVFMFKPIDRYIKKMPDSRLKRLLLRHIY